MIGEKLFNDAQDILDARGDATTHRAVANSDYHLAGRLFCSHCGNRYLGTAAKGNKYQYRYYTCFTRHRYGTEHCSADRLPADQLEHAVLTSLLNTLTRSDLIEQSLANTTSEVEDQRATYAAELSALERDITKNEDAIDRYLNAFENGTMDEDTCSPRVKKLATHLSRSRRWQRRSPPPRHADLCSPSRYHQPRNGCAHVHHPRRGQCANPTLRSRLTSDDYGAKGSHIAWIGAPGRIRTCDTRCLRKPGPIGSIVGYTWAGEEKSRRCGRLQPRVSGP
ncbi:zinc ribbon domain-containing protein [Amycolatopsis jejuensis]|uniref:zinc ribbon domain-containing protein n=1 Tax=Amycolatopsis jejuensis TaxID=330084 RepID=UPI000A05EB26